jgi:hypothetical protein
MILTCNSAVTSLMLSRFLYFKDMNDIDRSQTTDMIFNNDFLKMYNVSNNPLISILYTPIINTNQIKIIQ